MLNFTYKPIILNVVMLSVIMLNVIMLNVIMLNVIMLNVVMPNVFILSVVAPNKKPVLLIQLMFNVIDVNERVQYFQQNREE
jgi:hypothetical protein